MSGEPGGAITGGGSHVPVSTSFCSAVELIAESWAKVLSSQVSNRSLDCSTHSDKLLFLGCKVSAVSIFLEDRGEVVARIVAWPMNHPVVAICFWYTSWPLTTFMP